MTFASYRTIPDPNRLRTRGGPTPGRRALRGVLSSILWLFCSAAAWAQAPAAPAPAGGSSSSVVVSGRTFYGEIFLVAVLCGIVLFVVCRSSRRN